MYEELDRMMSLGVIEVSRSSWSSPVTLVTKANGKARLCLDARRVNEVTKRDAYPLPIIDGLLSRLEDTKFISSLDLKDAFWQIPLDQESRDKTAFTVPGRPLYQFTVMPFGLCNAPQTMCRLMDQVIPHELHERIFVYLDDLLITSKTFEEHLELLSLVATKLSAACLTVNIEKSHFLLKRINYLGYVIGDGILATNSEKVKAIQEYPVPTTLKQLRRFLGMAGWYRRFIRSFASLVSPLTDLTKKQNKFIWTNRAQEAFEKVKIALTNAPVLVHPNFGKPFVIQCDASTTGVGSVLLQKGDDGEDHPIAYMSQKLNAAQRNYSITELECFAAVLSVRRFRAYVEGYHFVIVTDHASLKWLMSQKELTGRLARWSLKLQAFDFTIQHRSGSQMVVPDALSRVFMEELLLHECGFDINLDSVAFKSLDYLNLVGKIQNNSASFSNFYVSDGKILVNTTNQNLTISATDLPKFKLYVPQPLVLHILNQAHNPPTSAHFGTSKMLERIQRYFYWPKMALDVREFVNSCKICKETKPVNYITRTKMGEQRIVVRPMQRLFVDFLGPYPRSKNGNCYLFIVLDHYSKFIFLKPFRKALATDVVKFLENEVFLAFSVPEYVVSDNGVQFTSKLFQNLMSKFNVKHSLIPRYCPQANASERVNRSIICALRAYISESQITWDQHIVEITAALRNVNHSSTKYSPHFLMFGQHLITNGKEYELLKLLNLEGEMNVLPETKANNLSICQQSVLKHLKEAHVRSSHNYNLRSKVRNLSVGQTVFVKNFVQSNAVNKFSAKLAHKFLECTILQKVGNTAYEVMRKDGKNLGIYHIKDIRT